jgi:hypothetical protein
MCVHGGTKKGEVMQMLTSISSVKPKHLEIKQDLQNWKPSDLIWLFESLGCFAIHISMKILAYLSTCMLMGYCH